MNYIYVFCLKFESPSVFSDLNLFIAWQPISWCEEKYHGMAWDWGGNRKKGSTKEVKEKEREMRMVMMMMMMLPLGKPIILHLCAYEE